ncbi:hypothetical protein [Actinomadura rudentiformis]|uniref:Uncharacterized protein n=1 Tax=Actinomadura rudentiformis TaxID=359158 RepID=A0A6H9YN56_9ACTN|nr:hypothetical protein [Actinomadura rudentiformis]KAB2344845.1 hypothetical protein F8566_30095 [Actinomadura rudentiformis]
MTTDAQHHPTQTMTTPQGGQVEIDVLLVPVITELWRLGYATLRSCQNGGESTLAGTTGAPKADIQRLAAYNQGKAWVTIREEDGPRLLAAVDALNPDFEWRSHQARTPGWVSITIPTDRLDDAAVLLRQLR